MDTSTRVYRAATLSLFDAEGRALARDMRADKHVADSASALAVAVVAFALAVVVQPKFLPGWGYPALFVVIVGCWLDMIYNVARMDADEDLDDDDDLDDDEDLEADADEDDTDDAEPVDSPRTATRPDADPWWGVA